MRDGKAVDLLSSDSDVAASSRSAPPPSKLAAGVALQIVNDVVERERPAGEVIGSEGELLERYGVSRAVLREAVRLVEHQHVARMRRGPGGGLVVVEPDIDAIIDAAVIYLLRVSATLDEVFEARLILEQMVTRLAPGRIDESDLLRIRTLLQDEAAGRVTDMRCLHTLLASFTRNPALELFVDVLNRVMRHYFRDRKALAEPEFKAAGHAHSRIAEAVLAGNEGLAQHRMTRHLQAEAQYLLRRAGAHQLLETKTALRGAAGSKRAEMVARELFGQVTDAGLEPGTLLGSESELITRYDVSRAVFREAVRILEHHQIAAMWRGRGGGLFVTEPSVAAVADVVAVHLRRSQASTSYLTEVRLGLDLAMIDLAVDGDQRRVGYILRRAIEFEAQAPQEDLAAASYYLHAALATASGNRVLELVARVLLRVSRLTPPPRTSRRAQLEAAEVAQRDHEGIVEAILRGDRDLARHRMTRHYAAASPHVS